MKAQFTILDREGIERIHRTAKRVLYDVGMRVYDDELCATLSRRGLWVDQEQQLVRFAPEVVEAALKAAPRSVVMADHQGNEIPLRSGLPLPAVYSNAIKVWDYALRDLRASTLEDLVTCVRLGDALPEVMVMCPVCLPADVPQQVQMARAMQIVLANSTKMTQSAPRMERRPGCGQRPSA